MALNVIESPIKVIGFNANFISEEYQLSDIDQVETFLYRGELVKGTRSESCSLSAVHKCNRFVLDANNLITQQVALIVVGDDLLNNNFTTEQFVSIDHVKHLSDALFISQKIISQQHDTPVLIISSSLKQNIKDPEGSTISFDSEFESYGSLQGVACVLLASESYAIENNRVLYASLDKVTTGTHAQIEDVIESALSGIDIATINTLEVSAHADITLNNIEQKALLAQYKNDKKLTTAISCHKSVLGENGCLSELMSLIHSVISLQQRYRPAIKGWNSPSPEMLHKWKNSPFYLFNQATPVFPNASGDARINTISLLTADDVSHLVLTEVNDGLIHQNGFNRCSIQSLFIIGANDEQTLTEKVNLFAEKVHQDSDIKLLASTLYQEQNDSEAIYKVVLIAESIDELMKEISLSLNGIKRCFVNTDNSSEWKTPKGSYFTSMPHSNAKTAFLYPGIGATYIGLGRDLFHLFPEIYPSVINIADNIGASLKDELMNPRSVVSLDFKSMKQLDLDLRNSLANIAECGVGYACIFTKIFEQVFKLKADFASGYSMGEISMFAALGCWQKPGLMSARLANSDTFNHQLSCELRAIRKLWQLPEIADGEFEQIWETYSIKGTVEQVTAEIGKDERVYVTIVNTPDSLVIGGFPEDCLKVIKRLGVRAMPLNMANAIHSEPAYQEYDRMLELYSMPVTERIETKMISSSCYLPIPQLQKAIAVSIAKCLCEPVDFPRLINTLAQRETKVFIEMGAGRSLCSWADKTLKVNPVTNHISVPVNAKGTDDQLTYARAMAKLVSFGMKVNIDSFFNGSLIQSVPVK